MAESGGYSKVQVPTVTELANGIESQLGVSDEKNDGVDPGVGDDFGIIEDYGEYPVCVKKDATLGRYLVAKRDIKKDEVFLRDKSVFKSPNSSTEPTCLGCCIKLKKPISCSKCGWPVCDRECEKNPEHQLNECEIFSKNDIKPELPSPYCFIAEAEFVKVLRMLVLSTGRSPEDEDNWRKIKTLEAHVELRKTAPKILFMTTLTKKFIRELCHLDQFDDDLIEFVIGVIDVNAFRHTIHPNNPLRQAEVVKAAKDLDRNASFLYPRGSMACHSCRRNCRWETDIDGNLEMRAAEDIKEGERLSHPYVDLMYGTPDRRRQLKDQFYFECSCNRCSDSTELGTYFSALKCPDCKPGYLLAVKPLDFETDWKCQKCPCIKSSEYERDLVIQIQSEKKTVLEMLEFGSCLATIGGLARILGKYQGKKVHQNHYAIIDIEYNLVKQMARVSKPTAELIHEMKRLILKFLDISNTFYPGIK